jgi:hypothetical protein
MARTHARLLTRIWGDEDFRALPVAAQHAYFTILSQPTPTISNAGVLDYRAGRLGALAADNTAKKLEAAVARLERGRFILVDRDTEELMVRTFIRHDGVLNLPNMGKSCADAFGRVVSIPIRSAIISELGRLYGDEPKLRGWSGWADRHPDEFDRIVAMSSTIPLPIASGKS